MYFNIKSLKIKLFKSYTGTKLRHLNIIASEKKNLQTHCGLFFILWNVNTEFLCGAVKAPTLLIMCREEWIYLSMKHTVPFPATAWDGFDSYFVDTNYTSIKTIPIMIKCSYVHRRIPVQMVTYLNGFPSLKKLYMILNHQSLQRHRSLHVLSLAEINDLETGFWLAQYGLFAVA